MLPVVCSSPAHTLRLCLFAAARGRRVTRIADPQAARTRARRSTQPQPPALQRQDLTVRINRKTLEYHSAHLELVAPSNFIFTLQSPASATDKHVCAKPFPHARVHEALPSRTPAPALCWSLPRGASSTIAVAASSPVGAAAPAPRPAAVGVTLAPVSCVRQHYKHMHEAAADAQSKTNTRL